MRSRPRQLLCITGRAIAPSFRARIALVAWLRRLPGLRVQVVRSLDALPKLRLERYRAILLYFHVSQIDEEPLAALEAFVRGGGGLIAIHSAAASFEDTPAYSAILGGRFLDSGEVASYTVRAVGRATEAPFDISGEAQGAPAGTPRRPELLPLFPEIRPFPLHDELAIHEYDPDNALHFVTDTEHGREPVAWSRVHGKGRVFYLAPGHRVQTLRHPSVRNILRHGIDWAATPAR